MNPIRRRARSVAGAALAAVVALGATACSGDDDGEKPQAESSATPTATKPAVQTRVRWGTIAGRLPAARRKATVKQVTAVVDGWLDAAYVGGDWPRTNFGPALRPFTKGARAQARRDIDLLSNRAIGSKVDGVEVTRRAIVLDAVGVRGRAQGVTARFVLGFRTSGDVRRAETVQGRLFLVPAGAQWRIFGYDIVRTDQRGATR